MPIVKTDTWGYVRQEDYDNPRFSFLKRDVGIPVTDREEKRFVDEYETDTMGNRRRVKKTVTVKVKAVTHEYIEWRKLECHRRGDKCSFDIDETPVPTESDLVPIERADWS